MPSDVDRPQRQEIRKRCSISGWNPVMTAFNESEGNVILRIRWEQEMCFFQSKSGLKRSTNVYIEPAMKFRGLVSLGALVMAGMLPAVGQNLVVNPGFEGPPAPPTESFINYLGGQSFAGWTVSGESVDLHGYVADTALTAHSGIGSLDLAGFDKGGGIFQNISTANGAQYQLDFWSMAHPYHTDPNPYVQIDVLWGGSALSPVIIPYPAGAGPTHWSYHEYLVTASGSMTELRLSTPSLNGGPVLDDISVTVVPEPSVGVLLPLGLAVACGWRRFKAGLQS